MRQTISMVRKENVTIVDEPFGLSPTVTARLIAFIEDPDGPLIELIERR